ncbi:transmembrane protein 33-like [Anneissia japonica]|uniref:transmembrane protein 33-like n=1 Tax=Anneissia japonica TaxID=1529436 RepID=UPI001425A8A5|nr:transmembrane protein 33-like [Anneissia japonica]
MPTIEEVPDDTTPTSTTNGSNGQQQQQQQQQRSWGVVSSHLLANKVDCGMWLSRISCVVFCIMYILPFSSREESYSYYQRALICNALTSALRLHQRMPPFQFTRQYLGLLLIEDSCHNLLYSLIFINGSAITIALIPVFLFSLLHSANYTRKLLDKAGPNSVPVLRNLINKLVIRQTEILRIIAFNEIILFPFLFFMLFYGKCSLLAPFMHFNFLVYRYASRRNPYTRQIMGELRMKAEEFGRRPSTPGFIKTTIDKLVALFSRFAVPMNGQR